MSASLSRRTRLRARRFPWQDRVVPTFGFTHCLDVRSAVAFGSAALVVLADQATKALVRSSLGYGELVPVTPFFNLAHYYNRGAAFGMFASSSANTLLLAFGIAAIAVLSVLLLRVGRDRWSAAALAAILGGAAGNVIDRVRFGAVVDWLDFYAGAWHWPAFNLADAALSAGVAIFLLAEILRKKAGKAGSDPNLRRS